jgi:two-component system, chemotaxis family, sensor histidine kinase and response regulator PixL
MTIDADIRDQAYEFFIQEAPELLQVIETELVTLTQDRSTNKIHNMMRAAHSLKGGSASVGLPIIAELSHKLEDYFKTLHHPELEIDSELEGLFLQAFDCLKLSVTEQIDTGNVDPDYIAEVMAPTLGRIEEKLGIFLGAETQLPNSIDLGVDIALSIFEVDIAQGLEGLRDVLDHPQDHVVAGELRAQAEVFSGISELLSMPGLGVIAHATIAALDANPSKVTEIAKIAIQDFEAARQAVIAGDRTQGGNPSQELMALVNSSLLGGLSSGLSTTLMPEELFWDDEITNIQTVEFPIERAIDDIFGEELEVNEVANISAAELELSMDDIFGEELEVNQLTNIPAAELELSMDDIFGDELSELEETPELPIELSMDDVFGEELGVNQLTNIPTAELELSMDDVFGDQRSELEESPIELSMDDVFAEDLVENYIDAISSEPLNLDNIFGESAIALSPNLALDPAPNLDDVFGDIDLSDESINAQVLSLENVFENNNIVQEPSPPVDVEAMVQSIEDMFDNLPQIDSLTSLVPSTTDLVPEKFEKYTSPKSSPKTTDSGAQLSVRVNIDRLERMNNLVGELAINRNGLSLQNDQMQETIQELLRRFAKFKQMSQQLRSFSDQMASAPDRYTTKSNGSANNQIPLSLQSPQIRLTSTSEFDSLELDSYSELYSLMQVALEDMAQIEETVDDVILLSAQSNQTLELQRQMLNRLRDDLMWARMLPLSEVLNRFPRNIRDLSTKYQKPVDLKLSGTGVLVDKAILEKLVDPLQHLLRNAFDHGIESPAMRLQRGKAERGAIEIRAYHQGSQTVIEVRDDGEGINLERIRQRAINQNLIGIDSNIPNSQLLDLMFKAGFSTAEQVTELSGRGVGLDVVRSQIQALKGTVSVAFESGRGTTFTLRIPLTLTIANLLVCIVGSTALALPSDSIEEIIVPKPSQIKQSGRQRFLQWRHQIVPIRHLSDFLGYQCPLPESIPSAALVSVPTPEDWASPLLIIRRDQQVVGLEIDRLVTEQELVIKPFGAAIAAPSYVYGCTILGDGSLIPVLDSLAILTKVMTGSDSVHVPKPQISSTQSATLLIVDDSIALRQTLALTLQKAGFRVLQARDGQEAIEQLEKNTTIKLVVCDVEMPNMNGFEFLTHRRQDPSLSRTPVVMLTSRSSDKHRRLAMHLGANGYFTKPYLEQEFITALKDTLARSQELTTVSSGF